MTRRLMTALALTACCGAVWAGPPAQKLYHLRKVPKFRVGARAVKKHKDVSTTTLTAPNGAVVRETRQSKASHLTYEVLKVDRAGRIDSLRVTIVRARWQANDKAGKPQGPGVTVEKIHFVARRSGLCFRPDTTTMVSETDTKLKASQIWLLKQYCDEEVAFAGYPEEDLMLLPAEPVPLGHSWKPTRQMLDEWVKANLGARAIQGKALSAEFKLASASKGIAVVEGTAHVQTTIGARKITVPFSLSARIDTGTGLWVGQTTSGTISMDLAAARFVQSGRGEEAVTFTPGRGRASALPEKLFALGWKPPGKDTNNYKDPAHGFSLSVPKGYKPRKAGLGEGILAAFANEAGSIITVGQGTGDRPMDADEFVRNFTTLMRRSVPHYAASGRKDQVLPGNVPAVLLRGTAEAGKVTLLTLAALDGPRVMTISGTAHTHRKQDLAELGEALGSVRLFDPDPTGGP